MKEAALINLCKQGNREALEQLVSENYPVVKGYLLKVTLNNYLSEDLTQECFLKALNNLYKFVPDKKFSTWLITIANNLYYDYLRKNKRITLGLDTDMENPHSQAALMDNSEFKEVVKLICELPYDKRIAFVLKHYYGYSYEEISKMVKCPIGTVKSRIFNAIEIIKSRLERSEAIEK
ncbi:MAG: RNA polymerase sigma factor SigY [Deltaproteobacteria bacterium]